MASTRRKSVTFNTARRCKGFTLLEVLVALTIVALALGALISTSGSHASSAGYLKQKTIAHWVAMNEITRLQVEKAWPGKGVEDIFPDLAHMDGCPAGNKICTRSSQQVRQVEG